MRSASLLGIALVLTSAPLLDGGPVGGGLLEKVEKSPWKVTMKFRGGEKATVLARAAAPESKTKLHVTISDAHGKTIVEASGKNPPSASMVAVFWYPPRDAEYTIAIKNLSEGANKCWVAMR